MAGKLSLLVGFGVGYVLGARSGRQRYDQIAGKAQQVWRDPRVQEKAGQAQQVVQQKAGQAGQVVKEKVASASSSSEDQAAVPPAGRTAGPGRRAASTGSGNRP
jgi:SLT domain-containing protein